MAVESDADRAAFFNADEFGLAAVYTPPGGGAGVPCTILLDRTDGDAAHGDGRPVSGRVVLQVQRSEVAAPARNGTFGPPAASVAGRNELTVTYTVMDRPQNEADALIWTLWAK